MNSNNSSGGGFFQGLLMGLLVGGGAVFFLGTKKGKKLLKAISEEGLESISEIEDLIEDEEQAYEEPIVVKSKPRESAKVVETYDEQNNHVVKNEDSAVGKVVSQTRRLFRGIPKKS